MGGTSPHKISLLVDVFLEMTNAEVMEADVTCYWSEPLKPSCYKGMRAPLPVLYLILTTWLNAFPLGRPGMS